MPANEILHLQKNSSYADIHTYMFVYVHNTYTVKKNCMYIEYSRRLYLCDVVEHKLLNLIYI